MLVYHGVSEQEVRDGAGCQDSRHVQIDRFSKQIDYLARHRRVLPLSDVVELMRQGRSVPPHTVAVTFDDGYRNNLTHAWTVLRSRRVPATIFLSTEWLDTQEMLWSDKVRYALDHISDRAEITIEVCGKSLTYPMSGPEARARTAVQVNRLCKSVTDCERRKIVQQLCEMDSAQLRVPPNHPYAPLSWDDVRQLHGDRLISFGAHGDGHLILSRVSAEESTRDISVCKEKIEQHLGVEIDLFAYPNGTAEDFTHETRSVVAGLGFKGAFSTIPGPMDTRDDFLQLRRVSVASDGDDFDFLARLSGLAAFLSRFRPHPAGLGTKRRVLEQEYRLSSGRTPGVWTRLGIVMFRSRGFSGTIARIARIVLRFGMTAGSFEAKLKSYADLTERFDCTPTFPVTAIALKRHPKLFARFARRNIEFAVHGYTHVDYRSLSAETQNAHMDKAIAIFESHHIPFVGFRAPYLRANAETLRALRGRQFAYDSSQAMLWHVVDGATSDSREWQDYRGVLEFYDARDVSHNLSLPRIADRLIAIPVSMPDDEVIVDRLGIRDYRRIAEIWERMLNESYDRGELFTLQLHPERIAICDRALESVLQLARRFDPPVWVASLREIAEWWKERKDFDCEIQAESNGRWLVEARCSPRATLLVRNCTTESPTYAWASGYQVVENRRFVVESQLRPFVGVAPTTSRDAVEFLRGEGYVVEKTGEPEEYSVYLDDLAEFDQSQEKSVVDAIEGSDCPLIRFWRWPSKARSALAVTGDVDATSLVDFAMRVYEGTREKTQAIHDLC